MSWAELRKMMEESNKRDEEIKNKRLAQIKKKYPEIDFEGKYITSDVIETRVYLDDTKYIKHDGFYIFDIKTYFGYSIEYHENYHEKYQIIDCGYKKLLISKLLPSSDEVRIEYYWSKTGELIKRKGLRRWLKIRKDKKGDYFKLSGEKYYIEL